MSLAHKTWQLIWANRWQLLQLLCVVYGPFYLAYGLSVAAGWLPADSADKMFGLVGFVISPAMNCILVWLAKRWYEGQSATLSDALRAMPTYWSRLLTAYIAIGFLLMGWLIVTVVPVYVLMQVTKFNQPVLLLPFVVATFSYAMSRFVFVDTLIVNEQRGPYQARHESTVLGEGRRWELVKLTFITYSLPSLLDLGGDLAAAVLPATEADLIAAVSTVTGVTSAALYVIPSLYFYLYYRSVVLPQRGAAPLTHSPN